MSIFLGVNNLSSGLIIPDSFNNSSHDFYNVYVNDDYIGKKILLAESEKISDLNKYLNQNNFNNFTSKVDENSLYISDDDLGESKHMKETLNVYLNID